VVRRHQECRGSFGSTVLEVAAWGERKSPNDYQSNGDLAMVECDRVKRVA
jgi:hypothetical protein